MSETIEQKCISKGVKLTDQRRIIAKVMSESQDHPDVDELYNSCLLYTSDAADE